MGFTPLQGLLMSTRSGDLDSAIVLHLLVRHNMDVRKVEALLNKDSGILGMSGLSGDIRDIIKNVSKAKGEERLRLTSTLDLYFWRLKKYLGAYLMVTGQPDAIIFTDTIGESVPAVRAALCKGMEPFGIVMDRKKNEQMKAFPADISAIKSRVRLLVIQTNEELAIARQVFAVASGNQHKEKFSMAVA
jgi:acetate kinase